MSQKTLSFTESDLAKLRKLVAKEREAGKTADEKYLAALESELDKGKVVKSEDIPSDIITMNSEVHLRDLKTQEERVYRLVFPEYADASLGKVSILAPIGTALLGYGVGDVIEWEVPAGVSKLEVIKILYQPEAAGDFDR